MSVDAGGLATDGGDMIPESAMTRSRSIIIVTPAVARAYAARIAKHLALLGHRVSISPSRAVLTPPTVEWLLYFESLAYRTVSVAFATVAVEAPSPGFVGDLIIDLAGVAPQSDVATIRLFFENGPGETGLLDALLSSQPVDLAIVVTQTGESDKILLRACLAVERPLALGSMLDVLTPRLATLIGQSIDRLGAGDGMPRRPSLAPQRPFHALSFAARALKRRITERLAQMVRKPDCWRIAVRTVGSGGGLFERLDWAGPSWRVLPDDGRRFFADPFLFAWEGRRWLFCEEFPYATGKGILSVAEVGADGAIGSPRPILETPGHLSWPQVFARDGQVYMIPESASAGRIDLWRAQEFPTRWVLDRVLVADVCAHDPVLHVTGAGAYMLATVNDDGGSSWDALGLFHAPDLFGEWRPHPGNPLIIDASCVRGASPLFERGGKLWRATQDCRTGYGDGLVMCRVTRLDKGGYAQSVVARFDAPAGLSAKGVHTISRLGDLEAIDLRGAQRTPPARLTRPS